MSEIKRPDKELLAQMKAAMEGLDTDKLNPDDSGFPSLPDGYFLTELSKVDFRTSKKGEPQIMLGLTTVEDGLSLDLDIHGKTKIKDIKNTKGIKAFKFYNITPDKVNRFAVDMIKYEDENGNRLLDKEAFLDPDLLFDAMQVLVELKARLYIKVDVNQDDNSSFTNFISWTKAKDLGLPID